MPRSAFDRDQIAGNTWRLENDRFEIYDRCPMSDVSMAISTDTDADADVACLSHLAVTGDRDVITADRDINDCDQLL